MTSALIALAVFAALVGHAAFCVGFVNRVHSTGAPRVVVIKLLSGIGHSLLLLAPLGIALYFWKFGWTGAGVSAQYAALVAYGVFACVLAAVVTVQWIGRHWLARPPAQVRSSETEIVDTRQTLGRRALHGVRAQWLSRFPGNQVLQVSVVHLDVQIARLPKQLDGLSIVLLSDWHFSGRIDIDYFHEVVRLANELQPDLVALCGDFCEEPREFDWLPQTLGQLRAKHGVYFVLGNHDYFTHQTKRERQILTDAGLVDLGGRYLQTRIHGAEVLLAGNELPWFSPAADMEHAPPRGASGEQFRLLLSHSPDQFRSARRWDFDLMLAGHTHGGQIRLPIVGPIFSPSVHGVKYASGTFFAEPTLMHVSRGISAELPIRLNCPPELTKLVLRCSNTAVRRASDLTADLRG